MKTFYRLVLILPVACILLLLSVFTFISGNRDAGSYDLYENRTLAETPVYEVSRLWDGTYFNEYETYLADHVWLRTDLLRTQTGLRMLYQPSVNDVVLSDTVLLRDNGLAAPTDPVALQASCDDITARLAAIQECTEQNGGVFLFVGIPSQRTVFQDAYPAYMNADSKRIAAVTNAFSKAADAANLPCLYLQTSSLEQGDYSAVDHHFTLKGAYRFYLEICDKLTADGLSFPVVTPEHITFSALKNPYLGSYSRKLYGLSPVEESLLTYQSDMEVPFRRFDYGGEVAPTVLTLPQTSEEPVAYTLYMGGDRAETFVQTNRPELPSILIVGDSFTNALESLFYMSFDELRSLDFRYYDKLTLSEYISSYQPEVVLFVRDDSSYALTEGNGSVK